MSSTPSTSETVNDVRDSNKGEAMIRRNVSFELDENPKLKNDKHCEKDCEINLESEPERIQQPKIPSGGRNNRDIIENYEERRRMDFIPKKREEEWEGIPRK
jgi:hypothetical protein